MPLDALLVELLVCPEDKQPLWYLESEQALYNPRLRRRYPVRDGIPVLLISEAEAVGDDEHARLVAKAQSEGVLTGSPTGGVDRGSGAGGSGDGGSGAGGRGAGGRGDSDSGGGDRGGDDAAR